MKSRSILLGLCALACACRAVAPEPSPAPPSPGADAIRASAAVDDPTLARAQGLFDEAQQAREAEQHDVARARVAQAIDLLLAGPPRDEDGARTDFLFELAQFASESGALRDAEKAQKQVLEVRTRKLPAEHPDLQAARQNLAVTTYNLGDLAGARVLFEQLLEALSRTRPDEHPDLQKARLNLAVTTKALGDLASARALELQVLEVLSRTLPEEHPDLQAARQNLAASLYRLGDLAGARDLFGRVLAVRSHTLPDEHPDLQKARLNLAVTTKALGDLAGARALFQQVLEVFTRTLPDEHPDLQAARQNLAATISSLGDLAGARDLFEQVLEVSSRTLPEEHPDLQAARLNLAVTIQALGDLAGARAMKQQVLEVRSRTLPDEHPDLQAAQLGLAVTLYSLGDLAGARALEEQVLEVRSRVLPDEHPSLQAARQDLALTVKALGDVAGARALEEKVLEVFTRTLPDEHPDLQGARQNLSSTLYTLGDLAGARALEEKVLEVRSRTLPDEHPDLQAARLNLAATIKEIGDLTGVRALEEEVLEVFSRTLPEEHPDLGRARGNLSQSLFMLGDVVGARALQEQVLEVFSRTLPVEHPELQRARQGLAVSLHALGDLAGARALFEQVLAVCSRTLPDEHPQLQSARQDLAVTIGCQLARAGRAPGKEGASTREWESWRERCVELMVAMCGAQVRAARAAILVGPSREAEERCSSLAQRLDASLSFAQGFGVFEPLRELESPSFAFAETTRGATMSLAGLARRVASSPRYDELRVELRRASDEFAGLAQKGTTSGEFERARMERESVERELVALAHELSGGRESELEFDAELLATRLGEGQSAVGFRRFTRVCVEVVDELDSTGEPAVREVSTASLCAFVVRGSKAGATRDESSSLTLVDLGPLQPIEEAVHAWLAGLGVGSDGRGIAVESREVSATDFTERGAALRERIVDPLLPALAGAQRIVVALDDVLHLVPLEALPLEEGALVGDRWRIETRATLTELLGDFEPARGNGRLVAFGGVEYGARDTLPGSDPANSSAPARVGPRSDEEAGILRGSAWSSGFSDLPGTEVEVRGIERSFRDRFGPAAEVELCEREAASRERLIELAPRARFLHIATHGWFAPESIRSWSDSEPLDKYTGFGMRQSGQDQVRGMSPMLLCGLALAGANLPENAVGRVPGLVTAEELSTLDLTNCELVVLSACDTNVGERRAGQGVASLQKALQMAGARSVITSLWKVPDEATKELMLDFYRRLWVEKKPKGQALWEAKMKLRAAKDAEGRSIYSTRDWAAWVLTGEPE